MRVGLGYPVEVGLVGDEGMLGVQFLLGVDESPLRAMVQGAGHAWRIDRSALLAELERDPALRRKLHRYLYVFIAQLMQSGAFVGVGGLAFGRFSEMVPSEHDKPVDEILAEVVKQVPRS